MKTLPRPEHAERDPADPADPAGQAGQAGQAGLWIIAGSIPDPDFSLYLGQAHVDGKSLVAGERRVPINRGTAALAAAALAAEQELAGRGAVSRLYCVLAGDTGRGQGSALVYKTLARELPHLRPCGITFHYLLPDVDNHNRLLAVLEGMQPSPLLVADAGHMYAAKMSGYAERYELFTPDIGELAFLADPDAPHPFYTRNFFLSDESMAEKLIAQAREYGNSARHLLVKGQVDRHVAPSGAITEINEPDIPMLEPIGGTGDTVTGVATAFLAHGADTQTACLAAMRTNREMGRLANPTPAWSVAELLEHLPAALAVARKQL